MLFITQVARLSLVAYQSAHVEQLRQQQAARLGTAALAVWRQNARLLKGLAKFRAVGAAFNPSPGLSCMDAEHLGCLCVRPVEQTFCCKFVVNSLMLCILCWYCHHIDCCCFSKNLCLVSCV